MKHTLTVFIFIASACIATCYAQDAKPTAVKIGVFDSKRLIQEHWKYPGIMASLKQEKARLDDIFRKKKMEVKAMSKERDALVESLQSPMLSADLKKKKELELKKIEQKGAMAVTELRNMERRFYKQMMDKEQEERQMLSKDIVAEIESYGKKNGYTLIIDKAPGIAYAHDSVVITDELLKQINAGHEEDVKKKDSDKDDESEKEKE